MANSYYDTDILSARFPLPRDFASYIDRERDADVYHINSRYGIMPIYWNERSDSNDHE